MADGDGSVQLRIRIPADLKQKIEASARQHQHLRSINGEYAHRLTKSFYLDDEVENLRKQNDDLLRELEDCKDRLRMSQLPNGRFAKSNDAEVLAEKLTAISTDLRSLRVSVTIAEQAHREIGDLEELLRLDTMKVEEQLSPEQPDPAHRPFSPVPLTPLPLARDLLRQIDIRTSAIVGLALAYATTTKDTPRIQRIIERDHALLVEDRFAAKQELSAAGETK